MAHGVVVAGIEKRHARVESGVDGGDAFVAVGRTVERGHAHASEAERADFRTVLSESAGGHHDVLLVFETSYIAYVLTDFNICQYAFRASDWGYGN